MKSLIRKIFNITEEKAISFYVANFFFKKILRRNVDVKWPIHYTSTIHSPERIVRGKEVFPGDSPCNFIDARNGIEIGDYTNIGPNVGILSANHDLIDNSKYIDAKPIRIGKFCWLGMNAVILPEVQLGDFTIVGANAVVTKSFSEGYCVIAGNPAVKVKILDKQECDEFKKSKS